MRKREGKWLVAVSGGPDSMALLDMMLKSGTEICAAHVNYHQRPEADAEEAWVREYCRQNGIGCYVRNEPFVYEGNFEAAAREWRYSFFVRLVQEHGLAGMMTAHQQDDHIETYLMQKEKGITPSYWGIRPSLMYQGVRLERPLLDMAKSEILEYCREKQIRWYLDASNQSDQYTRNRIRHEVVEKLTPSERAMILREIRLENAVMQEQKCRVSVLDEGGKISLAAYRRLSAEDRLALLRICIGGSSPLSRAFLLETDEILMKRDDFLIGIKGRRLVQAGGKFFMREEIPAYAFVCRDLEEVKALGRQKAFVIGEGSPGVNALTVHEDDWPLTIRSWREGDRIQMRFGTKSVHRFFIDRHIPLGARDSWPVVEDCRGNVILVSGLGCDRHHFSVCPDFNVIQYIA